MKLPGFVANNSLGRSGTYWTRLTSEKVAQLPIVTAMDDVKNPKEVVDCRDYANSFCKECGYTGRDSFVCCHTKKCVVVVDPKGGGSGGRG